MQTEPKNFFVIDHNQTDFALESLLDSPRLNILSFSRDQQFCAPVDKLTMIGSIICLPSGG
jgi:hypothetical protein